MKKIISLSVCVLMMFSLFTVASANMQDNVTLFYSENFENISTSASEWISGTVTGEGIKAYDFVEENENTALKFTGWTDAEKASDGKATFVITPAQNYSLADYPDTVLVYRFKINLEAWDKAGNLLYFDGKDSGGNSRRMGYLQFAAASDNKSTVKLNGSTVSGAVSIGVDTDVTVICNFSTNKISVIIGENAMQTRNFSSRTVPTMSDSFSIEIDKNQALTVDDICVYSAKTQNYAFEAMGFDCTDNRNVKVDSVVSAQLSSFPAGNFRNYVEIKKNDTVIDSSEYALGSKMVVDNGVPHVSLDVKFVNDMAYNTNYTITLKQGMTDILGSSLADDVIYTYKTEQKPQLTLVSFTGTTGYFGTGSNIEAGSDFSGKYTVFTANIQNNMVNDTEAYVVIALYNSNDEIIDCGFVKSGFLSGTSKTFSHGFYVPQNTTVKCFAVSSLQTMDSLMDAVSFQ